jgi:hypothetical protein
MSETGLIIILIVVVVGSILLGALSKKSKGELDFDVYRKQDPRVRQIAVNRAAQKHFDFVICSGPSLVPVCAIELNDSSHYSSSAKRRDEFLSSVCTQVGLPLVVIKAARSYPPEEIRRPISVNVNPAS